MPRLKKMRTEEPKISFIDENSKILQLTKQQACEKFGMQAWNETIINADNTSIPLPPEIIKESENTQAKMSIETIEIDGDIMYGLIANTTIKKDEFIIYASKETDASKETQGNETDRYKLLFKENKIVSARYFGNLSRFMNHAPEKSLADRLIRLRESEEELVCANFTAVNKKTHDDIIYPTLVANRDILPGEKLVWDYSLRYFQKLNCNISLFSTRGVINPNNYDWINKILQIKIDNKIRDIGPLNKFLENEDLNSEIITKICFIDDISYTLAINSDAIIQLLRENPNLLKEYFVRINLDSINQQNCKRIIGCSNVNVDDEINNYIKKELLENNGDIKFEKNTFRRRDAINSPSSAQNNTNNIEQQYKAFIGFTYNEALLQRITNFCELRNIEFYCNENKNIYVSYTDIFKCIPSATEKEIRESYNPRVTPPNGVVYINTGDDENIPLDDEIEEESNIRRFYR